MIGAIIGDIVGSIYQFDRNNIKTTDFEFITDDCYFTDDTIMSVAVSEAIIAGYDNPRLTKRYLVKYMQKFGRYYIDFEYGVNFFEWIHSDNPMPYYSCGNGSAMRVASVAWLYHNLEDVQKYAEISASVTHDHPEGIDGAVAIATAIFMARTGKSKDEIKKYISTYIGYDLDTSCDEYRKTSTFDPTCQGSVPQAIRAFLEGDSFENVVRLAVSIGGDSDTIAAMAGSIAEAFYGIPENIKRKALSKLDNQLRAKVEHFEMYRDGEIY